MGLLDFFQNGSNNNAQGDNTNPPAVPDFASIQQSYTNQSLANVSYPMANPAPVVPTASPVTPQTNITQDQTQQYPGLQNLQMPTMQPGAAVAPVPFVPDMTAQPMPAPINEPMQSQAPMVSDVQPTQPETQDVPSYEYVDPSKHPVLPAVIPNQGHIETMPEGIKVTTFEPATEAPSAEPVQEVAPENTQPVTDVQPIEQTIIQPQENTQLEQNTWIQPEATIPQPEVVNNFEANTVEQPVQTPTTGFDASMFKTEVTTPTEQPAELQMPDLAPVTEPVVEQPLTPEVPVTSEVETVPESTPETKPEDLMTGLEIGVGESTTPEQPLVSDVTPELEVSVPTEVTPEVAPELEIQSEPNVELNTEVPNAEMPAQETFVPETTQVNEVLPAVTMQDEVQTENVPAPEKNIESTPVVQPTNFEMSFFRTIGFIGLNSQPNIKVVEKVNELSSKLAEFAEVFIIDSAKGYAKTIFDNAKSKGIELTGMYLKPFHSDYSDESELGDYEDFTIIMYSNTADKIKNIIKESDLLIMPEVFGLNNLAILFEVWSTSSMYPGQNKPLILVGKGWTTILTQLKSMFKLTDSDLGFVSVCTTTEEALSRIKELDSVLITKEVKAPRRVIDLREEDDEDGLFI